MRPMKPIPNEESFEISVLHGDSHAGFNTEYQLKITSKDFVLLAADAKITNANNKVLISASKLRSQ